LNIGSSDNLKDLESEGEYYIDCLICQVTDLISKLENFQYSAFKLPLRRIVMTFICD
jgi:hypothetical protein